MQRAKRYWRMRAMCPSGQLSLMAAFGGFALTCFASSVVVAVPRAEHSESHERSLLEPNGPLNPNGYPRLTVGEHISLDDPIAEANASMAMDDFRPFKNFGFTAPTYQNAPGIVCPSRSGWTYDYRGGTLYSDLPGSSPISNAPPEKMEQFNQTLAGTARFRAITGCVPAPR